MNARRYRYFAHTPDPTDSMLSTASCGQAVDANMEWV